MGVKISALPAATALVGTEVFPAVQSGATVKATLDQVATLLQTIGPFVQGGTGAVATTMQTKVRRVQVDIEDFGGSTALADNSAALQLAINRLSVLGGGTVKFGPGTYLFQCPNTAGATYSFSYSVLMASHVHYEGVGGTIIKLANSVIGTPRRIAIFFSVSTLSDISFSDIIFDMNGANNVMGASNYQTLALGWSNDDACCTDLLVERCTFKEYSGTQVLSLSQSNTANSALGQRNIIRDNYFYLTNANNSVTDLTTLGGVVNDSLIEGNTFAFSAIRTDQVGVVVDLQGRNNRFVNNLVQNYFIGVQLGTNHTTDTYDCVVANNVFNPMKYAAVNFYHGSAGEKLIGRSLIADNVIELEDTSTGGAVYSKGGIICFTPLSVNNVTITGNLIRKTGTSQESRGIVVSPNGEAYTGWVVKGNTTIGCYEGIVVQPVAASSNLGSVEISDNTIEATTNVGAGSSFGIKVYLQNTVTCDVLSITNNKIVKTVSCIWGILVQSAVGNDTFTRIIADGNVFEGTFSNSGPTTFQSYTESNVSKTTTTRFGSETAYRAAIPSAGTDGTWFVNQRQIRVPAAAGQPKAWVCTVAGNPGTWVSEGNL